MLQCCVLSHILTLCAMAALQRGQWARSLSQRLQLQRWPQGRKMISHFLSIQTTHSADWNVSIGGAEGAPSSLGSAGAVGASSSISVGGALGSADSPLSMLLSLAFSFLFISSYSSTLALIFFLIYSLETPSSIRSLSCMKRSSF